MVPGVSLDMEEDEEWDVREGRKEGGRYQFAAMMGFPSGLTRFDLGFCRTFAIEDLFFFFWSSRPIIAMLESELVEFTVGASSPQKVSKLLKSKIIFKFLILSIT